MHRKANTEVIALCWFIGHTIIERQRTELSETGVLARFATDLRAEFPTMEGFSESNLK